jgi:hypothetical protein
VADVVTVEAALISWAAANWATAEVSLIPRTAAKEQQL